MRTDFLNKLRFFDPDEIKKLVSLESSGDRVVNGLLCIHDSNGLRRLCPIVNGILIAIEPEGIVADELREGINRLIDSLSGTISPQEIAWLRGYKIRMDSGDKTSIRTQEIMYYESVYRQRCAGATTQQPRYGDHWLTTTRWVLRPMFAEGQLAGKWVIEIGGGDFYTLATFMPQEEGGYEFVGTEVSYNALRCGQRLFPRGSFVLCDSDSLVFARNSFDYVFVKGALHHQTKRERVLEELFEVLKSGGTLGFSEVVAPIKREWSLSQTLTRVMHSKKHTSPMNESIGYETALDICEQRGKIISKKHFGSIARLLLATLLGRQKAKSLAISRFICYVDDLFNDSFPFRAWRVTRTFGLAVVVQKNENS